MLWVGGGLLSITSWPSAQRVSVHLPPPCSRRHCRCCQHSLSSQLLPCTLHTGTEVDLPADFLSDLPVPCHLPSPPAVDLHTPNFVGESLQMDGQTMPATG